MPQPEEVLAIGEPGEAAEAFADAIQHNQNAHLVAVPMGSGSMEYFFQVTEIDSIKEVE